MGIRENLGVSRGPFGQSFVKLSEGPQTSRGTLGDPRNLEVNFELLKFQRWGVLSAK